MTRHPSIYAIPPKTIRLRPGPATGLQTQCPPLGTKHPTAKFHQFQFLSGILKSVAVALGIPAVAFGSLASTKVLKTKEYLAFTASAVFIVWDIRNLSHDEPIDVEVKKTIREDPATALADAREKLKRMMREEGSRG